MVNINSLVDIMNWQDNNKDYPFFFEENTADVLSAIGDNCDEFKEFIRNSDKNMLLFLSQFAESITEKFNYDDSLMNLTDEYFPW